MGLDVQNTTECHGWPDGYHSFFCVVPLVMLACTTSPTGRTLLHAPTEKKGSNVC